MMMVAAAAGGQTAAVQSAGQRYKSVQVLTDIPSDQVIPTMATIANSLGVTCAHCHTAVWESDEKPAKQKAREMIRLTQAINRDHYAGRVVVTCQTCHDGRVTPASVPRLDDAGWNRPAAAKAPPLPAIETVLAAYLRAMGGQPALEKLASRLVTGVVTRANGRSDPASGPFRLYQDSAGKASLSTELSHPPEADAEVSASLVRPLLTSRVYKDLQVVGVDRVRGSDVFVVAGRNPRGVEHRMYFDQHSGLLLRRTDEIPTVVGALPERYEFDDYRAVDGVMVAHKITWERGDYQVAFTFNAVAHNVPDGGGGR